MLLLSRILGVWLLLLAMVAAVIDATKSLGGGGTWVATPMLDEWTALSPESLAASKAAVVAYTTPYVWDPVLTTIMHAPTWVVFGVLGIGLYWLGQKRKPAEVYIN
jgi:hypothetical protein